MSRVRRGYQDYSSWQSFGTEVFWHDVRENGAVAHEMVTQRLSDLNLQNPSESCSRLIAGGILVAVHGPRSKLLSASECDQMFAWFKARPCSVP
jgi:hypothetical protein